MDLTGVCKTIVSSDDISFLCSRSDTRLMPSPLIWYSFPISFSFSFSCPCPRLFSSPLSLFLPFPLVIANLLFIASSEDELKRNCLFLSKVLLISNGQMWDK